MSNEAAIAARAAAESQLPVFVYVFTGWRLQADQVMRSAAAEIAAIEAEGWRLEHFSPAWYDGSATPLVATGLFRRRTPSV